jgi:hypothetical protein
MSEKDISFTFLSDIFTSLTDVKFSVQNCHISAFSGHERTAKTGLQASQRKESAHHSG